MVEDVVERDVEFLRRVAAGLQQPACRQRIRIDEQLLGGAVVVVDLHRRHRRDPRRLVGIAGLAVAGRVFLHRATDEVPAGEDMGETAHGVLVVGRNRLAARQHFGTVEIELRQADGKQL
jgi:hypothetical protein